MSGQRVDSPRHGLAVLRCRGIAIIEHRQALGKEAAASSINGTSLNPLRATKAPAAKGGQAHARRRPPITRSCWLSPIRSNTTWTGEGQIKWPQSTTTSPLGGLAR